MSRGDYSRVPEDKISERQRERSHSPLYWGAELDLSNFKKEG